VASFFFILFVEGGGHLSSINHANLYGGVPREMNPLRNNRVSCCVASRGNKVTVAKVYAASTLLFGRSCTFDMREKEKDGAHLSPKTIKVLWAIIGISQVFRSICIIHILWLCVL
jgi:hypothetical protein